MRPNNNQNKRSRGRGNSGGRRHSNPLSRNFESNGPDMKIRGNASHIAEKYMQLARDAHASGDSVMAENYYQHAEHYFRIVSAAQAQAVQRNEQQPQPQQVGNDSQGDTGGGVGSESVKVDDGAQDAQPASPAQPASTESSDEADGEGEGGEAASPRKPRERRPRRKPRVAADDAAANPGDAPQPEVGDLPAFLTGGGQTDAAE